MQAGPSFVSTMFRWEKVRHLLHLTYLNLFVALAAKFWWLEVVPPVAQWLRNYQENWMIRNKLLCWNPAMWVTNKNLNMWHTLLSLIINSFNFFRCIIISLCLLWLVVVSVLMHHREDTWKRFCHRKRNGWKPLSLDFNQTLTKCRHIMEIL